VLSFDTGRVLFAIAAAMLIGAAGIPAVIEAI
jgi:hypothetical protein